jgi:hypothetical protein
MVVSRLHLMATTPTVPSAPVSAPAPTSSPAPAASTSTPSTPSVQSTTPAAQPSTPAAVPTEQKSLEQRIAENIQKGYDKPAATSVEAQANEAAAQVFDTPAGESTETPAEQTAPEQPAAEQTAGEDDAFEWEAPRTATPKELIEKLNAKPELKAALEADPEIRDLIFSNARVAAKNKAYSELFGSVDEARTVSDGHKTFANLRNLMGQVKPGDLSSTQPFINAMLEQGALRDEEGNPLRRQDGSLVTDGSVGRLMNNLAQLRLANSKPKRKRTGDNETLAALDTIMERAGFRAPSSVAEDEMSDSLKAQKAELDAERKQMDEARATQQKAAQTNHDNTVFGKIDFHSTRQ